MKYGYEVQGNAQMVLDAEDVVHARKLRCLCDFYAYKV